MSLVVVIEPIVSERARLLALLSRRRNGNAIGLASLSEACEAFGSDAHVRFVIVGVPRGSEAHVGTDVAGLRLRWARAGFIVAADEPSDLDIDLGSDLHLDRRPLSVQRLELLLRRHLRTSETSIPQLSAPDVIQMACVGRHTLSIACARDGRDVGTIEVLHGECWSARDERGEGMQALARLCAPGTVARTKPLDAEDAGTRNLEGDWQLVLFEAARIADQNAPQTLSERSFDGLLRDAGEALLRRDYERARDLFVEAAARRPDDPLVKVNLERLRKLGYARRDEG